MPIPETGPVSILDVRNEFAPTKNPPHSLNQFYSGGSFVPAGTTGKNGVIPSSGTISLDDFRGSSNVIPVEILAYKTAQSNGDNAQVINQLDVASTWTAVGGGTYTGTVLSSDLLVSLWAFARGGVAVDPAPDNFTVRLPSAGINNSGGGSVTVQVATATKGSLTQTAYRPAAGGSSNGYCVGILLVRNANLSNPITASDSYVSDSVLSPQLATAGTSINAPVGSMGVLLNGARHTSGNSPGNQTGYTSFTRRIWSDTRNMSNHDPAIYVNSVPTSRSGTIGEANLSGGAGTNVAQACWSTYMFAINPA
jgi:hypothetical protein